MADRPVMTAGPLEAVTVTSPFVETESSLAAGPTLTPTPDSDETDPSPTQAPATITETVVVAPSPAKETPSLVTSPSSSSSTTSTSKVKATSTETDVLTFVAISVSPSKTSSKTVSTPSGPAQAAASSSAVRVSHQAVSKTKTTTTSSSRQTTTSRTRATSMRSSSQAHQVGTALTFASDTTTSSATLAVGVVDGGSGGTSRITSTPTPAKGGKSGKDNAENGEDGVAHKSGGGDVNIGMVIGIVAGVLVFIGIAIFIWSRWRKKQKQKEEIQMLNDEDGFDDRRSEFSSGRPLSDRETYMSGMTTADPRTRETVYTEYDPRRTYADTELLDDKSYRYDIDKDTLVTKGGRSSYWAGPRTGQTTAAPYTPWVPPETSIPPVPQLPSAFLKKETSQAEPTITRPMTQMTSYGSLLSAYDGEGSYSAEGAAVPASRPASTFSTMTENLLPWLKRGSSSPKTPPLPTAPDAYTPQGRSHKPTSRPISFRRLTGEKVTKPPTAPPVVRPPPVPVMAKTPIGVTTQFSRYDGPMPAFR